MQKSKQELNANTVGANCIRPHLEGMAQNKGITLIALIITIIVMLILVGVTINVALNGGLFKKAENATIKTQIEAEKEELLSAVIAAIGNDAKVDFDYLDKNLPTDEWSGSDGTYTSPKGNTYTVDENGKITEGETNSGGESDKPDYSELNVGTTIYYDSNLDNTKEEWIVYSISEDKTNIEIISANTMVGADGGLTLGYNDPYLPESVGDLSENGTAEENCDKAIWSYNNAIESINKHCESMVTAKDNSGVRSIGSTVSQDLANIEHFNVLKGSDTYGLETIEYLSNLNGNNCLFSKDSTNYWIASRKYLSGGNYNWAIYQIGAMDFTYDTMITGEKENLARILECSLGGLEHSCIGYSKTAGVRPIVSNPINYSLNNE